MKQKLKIADAGNVAVPAYLVLQQKGYQVRCETEDSQETWFAENDTAELIAEDIVALLGLVALAEFRGHNWKASDGEIDDFVQKFGYDIEPS